MDGVRYYRELISLPDFVAEAQPLPWFSCDWIGDPLALGLAIFPLEIYRKMEALNACDNGASEQG